MLDSLSPPRRRMVLGVGGLVLLGLLAIAGLVGVRALAPTPEVEQGDLGPVLLVAGYGGSTEALRPLRGQLLALGRDVVVVPPVGRNTGDVDAQAEALGEAADEAMDDAGADTVDVVGYSLGGVVARLWVREHGGDEVARRVMTVGSPHHGAALAELASSFGSCPPACRQIEPGSDLLRQLNADDETPDGPRWVSVWSTSDRVATPPETARLDGALDLTVQSLCPGSTTSHGALPGDPVVQGLLESALGAAAPALPEDVDCDVSS